jgi:hypothetical protein
LHERKKRKKKEKKEKRNVSICLSSSDVGFFVAGLSLMSRLGHDRHQQLEYDFEERSLDWDSVVM